MKRLRVCVLLLVALASRPSWPCACPGVEPPSRALDESDVAFSGRVVTVRSSNEDGRDDEFVIEVEQVWKGLVLDETLVPTDPVGCSAVDRVGGPFVFFGRRIWVEGSLRFVADACTGSRADPSGAVAASLGPGRRPLSRYALGGVSLFVLASFVFGVLVARRNKRSETFG